MRKRVVDVMTSRCVLCLVRATRAAAQQQSESINNDQQKLYDGGVSGRR